jgi:hypothetical protein
MKQLQETFAAVPAKTIRMSAVGLAAGVMGVVWALIDEYTALGAPAVVVSAVTSLVMLVAQFVDVRAKEQGAEVIDPTE